MLGKDLVVMVLLFYYIFVLIVNCLLFLKFGCLNLLIMNFCDMFGFVKELSKYLFVILLGVNILFNGLFNIFGFVDLDFINFKFGLGGGMVV